MAQKHRMTQDEWNRFLPAMQTFTHLTTEIGHSVLVKGERRKDVADRVGRTKQNVGNTVKRIWELYQSITLDTEDGKLHFVNGWVSEELALKVQAEAAKYNINQPKIDALK
ncbi:TrfB-related DNA-binding protein [Photorhabdus luminescens]|uniref:TrfB-related DNA-binding protein n=1 Tax=Photorhabdus luminescens TaxID=29488 RepID=UPI00223F801A|nr:TrfB-related DNA-binding protein [Photorhabdus luminescens]MCW7763381.1 transcriptional regulator KorA [Photorhabdus luminescens subsp. venezuelensis]